MRVIIITDLEGVSCVNSIDMITDEGYIKACELLMDDTNAAADGAFAGGADEVVVVDGHGGGNNFIKERLDNRAVQLAAGEFIYSGFDCYDAVVCIGAHAMAGTERAFLDHTQNSREWFEFTVGGKSYGELGQQAITAGAFGVPIVAVSGDTAACNEAKALFPDIACAEVKTAKVRNRAECLEQAEALKLIFEAVKDGVERCKKIKPYKISLPTEKALTFYRSDMCDTAMHEGLIREGRTIKKTIEKIENYTDVVWF